MNILNTDDVKNMLDLNPQAEFSLQPIRVEFEGGHGHIVAGYHIFAGHLPRMVHTTGDAIWTYVQKPGENRNPPEVEDA